MSKSKGNRNVVVFAMFAVMALGGVMSGRAEPSKSKPNVIFIVADDIDRKLSSRGDTTVQMTPQIDSLGAKGVVFANAYAQVPLCNPSRVSFLSGKRPETTGVLDNFTPPNRFVSDLEFLPSFFQRNGYTTYGVGKVAQQSSKPSFKAVNEAGWDKYEVIGSPISGFNWRKGDKSTIGPVQGGWLRVDNPADEKRLVDTRRTALAREFIKEGGAQKDKPFLLYVGYKVPHRNGPVPKRFFDLYANKDIPWQIPLTRRGDTYSGESEEQLRERMLGYYAAVSYLDDLVGEILTEITDQDLWKNTVVVFAGDHSAFGKDRLRQQGTPLIIYAPDRAGNGKICSRVVELLDIYPTLVDLCGLPMPKGLEGKSLVPLLNDPDIPWDGVAQTTYLRHRGVDAFDVGRALSTEDFRYIEWDNASPHGMEREFYDLRSDPDELKNLADDPQYADKMRELSALIIRGDQQLTRLTRLEIRELRAAAKEAAKQRKKDSATDEEEEEDN